MLLILLLFFAGIFFLHPCIAIIFQKKPAVKADWLKSVILMLLFAFLVETLRVTFLAFVMAYGFSYNGITLDAKYSYVALIMLLSAIGVLLYTAIVRFKLRSTSLAIVGIDKAHALPALYKTLEQMGLGYIETVSKLSLPDMDMDIEIFLHKYEIRFRTARPIDKIFLRRLCRMYQEQYRHHAFPIPKNYVVFAVLKGGVCMAVAAYLLFDWLAILASTY